MSGESCAVRVFVRFRPTNDRERKEAVDASFKLSLEPAALAIALKGKETLTFNFDEVFGPDSQQERVYDTVARAAIDDVLLGYNATIFAYGQTGAGKSHTMFGREGSDGIIPRAAKHIFDAIANSNEEREFSIRASFLEIYREQLRDLLSPSATKLAIREDKKRIWVEGLSEEYVSCADDVLDLIQSGEKLRATASTKMNETSSRSHSVMMIRVMSKGIEGSSGGARPLDATLNLIDLAGSERISKTGATGTTLAEAQKINQSLSALGNVINALSSRGGDGHIPYRDSQLTRLLQQSLGGNCKTRLVVACSPSSFNAEETISSLRFGQRAKTIVQKVHKNEEKGVEELKAEIKHLRGVVLELQKLLSGGGGGAVSADDRAAILKLTRSVVGGDGAAEQGSSGNGNETGVMDMGGMGAAAEAEAQLDSLRAEHDALMIECDKLRDAGEAAGVREAELVAQVAAAQADAERRERKLLLRIDEMENDFRVDMERVVQQAPNGSQDLSNVRMELVDEQSARRRADASVAELSARVRELEEQMMQMVPRSQLEQLEADNAALRSAAEVSQARRARLFRPIKSGGQHKSAVKEAFETKIDYNEFRGKLKSVSSDKQLW